MVAVNRDGGKPTAVPELLLTDDEARVEYHLGAEIHEAIIARRAS